MVLRTLEIPNVKFDGIGQCIFCLRTDVDLTVEHVIPRALSGIGEMYISGGSCGPCNAHMNEAFENAALQNDFRGIRALLELKRRKKKRRLEAPEIWLEKELGEMVPAADLAVDELPSLAPLVVLEPAGLLVGVNRPVDLVNPRVAFIDFRPANQKWRAVETRWPMVSGAVPLTVAKIAYTYAVASSGIGSFRGEHMRELLFRKRDDVYNFVGRAPAVENLPRRRFHYLSQRRRAGLTTVIVHLFASFGAPAFEVVVGGSLD